MSPATPEYVDVAGVLNGTVTAPQTASGGVRTDGVRLLYPAAVNVLLGAPEAGKTLCAGGMAADEIFGGGRVLWCDLDHNGAAAILARLRRFGVARDALADRDRFRLCIPEDADAMAAIVADAPGWTPTLAVVDSIGELLPMYGANSNDADDYTRVHRQVLTALANAGAGVLGIDHEAKGEASRSYGATGSAAKKRAVDGALLRVTNVQPFTPGAGGRSELSVVKDRHGALRALAFGREPTVAVFTVMPVEGGARYSFLVPPPAAAERADADLELVLAMDPPPTGYRQIKEEFKWRDGRAQAAMRAFNAHRDRTQAHPGCTPGAGTEHCTPAPTPYRGVQGASAGAPADDPLEHIIDSIAANA